MRFIYARADTCNMNSSLKNCVTGARTYLTPMGTHLGLKFKGQTVLLSLIHAIAFGTVHVLRREQFAEADIQRKLIRKCMTMLMC